MSVESWNAAIAMADAGYRVFPLRPGDKRPMKKREDIKTINKENDKGGFHVATNDSVEVEFWANELVNSNFGIATGTNITVLDLDRHGPIQNGIEVFEYWAKTCGKGQPGFRDPISYFKENTLVVETPSNGLHIYFQFFDGISRTLTDGIEMQNWGRYVVGPISQTSKGMYIPCTDKIPKDTELLKAPFWIREAIKGCYEKQIGIRAATTKLPIQWFVTTNDGMVPIGARHDAVFMEIVELVRDELSQYEIYEKINQLILNHVPEPQDFSDGEIKRNIKNALRQHGKEPEKWLYE